MRNWNQLHWQSQATGLTSSHQRVMMCASAGQHELGGIVRRSAPSMKGALLVFLMINVMVFAMAGVRLGGDTPMFTGGADSLLKGQPLSGRQRSYLGYIGMVAVSQTIGIGLKGQVLAQIAIAVLAAAAVYRLAVEISSQIAGFLAVIAFALDLHTNRWHIYVLSDSVYLSIFTLSVWLVHQAGKPPFDLRQYVVAAGGLVAAALIRPEGWFLLPAAAAYWVGLGTTIPRHRLAGFMAVAVSCAFLAITVRPLFSGNLEAVGPGEMLRRGQTIWQYDGWRLSMPADPSFDGTDANAGNWVNYAVKHPFSTLGLMTARLAVHIAHVRPFYSLVHNALIVFWLVPAYALAGFAIWMHRKQNLTRWCAVSVATQALVVAITHADWDGRYLAHVLPLGYVFAASGLVIVIDRWIGVFRYDTSGYHPI